MSCCIYEVVVGLVIYMKYLWSSCIYEVVVGLVYI